MSKIRLAIFASGTGSNAVNLINYFSVNSEIEVAFVLSNKQDAKVLGSAKDLGVETYFFPNSEVAQNGVLLELCENNSVDWIILAGYLRLIPVALINAFDNRIINLHPSLLPKYGGKGMFGRNVHQAVLEGQETETGITIHFVNKEFDKGEIIAQFHCKIEQSDKVEDIEQKIHSLEQKNFPSAIEATILNY
tara:strand:+ start:38569 stop:39144 length:576 start_codon:yes stop_codon:yes gene_type:complete